MEETRERYKSWPIGEQFRTHLARTTPGRGMSEKDEGLPGSSKVKLKSVPNVSTPRLERRLEHFHGMLHTDEGLEQWSESKRSLVEQGIHLRTIAHELTLRGQPQGECRYCWGH
jgi:hypothetical protein